MDYFTRKEQTGELKVEQVSFCDIAKECGSPAYVYTQAGITSAFDSFKQAVSTFSPLICVSVKANSNLSILQLLSQRGAGFDVVSGGELARVVAAGGDPRKAVFAGVGKTDQEIFYGLEQNILMFNVESREELERIDSLAKSRNLKAPVSLRVNPDVDAKTHAYISTGMEKHKFGIAREQAAEIYRSQTEFPNINFVGLDCHIGSMISDMNAFSEAFARMKEFATELRAEVPSLRYLDLGGGLGVSYQREVAGPCVTEYGRAVEECFSGTDFELIFEPGRFIFANSGVLLTQVLFTKQNSRKRFIIVDSGFSDLLRPALYQAHHDIEPVIAQGDPAELPADLVGPICESGDCFAEERQIQQLRRGDLVVVFSSGAYGFTMASNYNTRPRPAEVLVEGDSFRVIRPRETLESLFADEISCLKV